MVPYGTTLRRTARHTGLAPSLLHSLFLTCCGVILVSMGIRRSWVSAAYCWLILVSYNVVAWGKAAGYGFLFLNWFFLII